MPPHASFQKSPRSESGWEWLALFWRGAALWGAGKGRTQAVTQVSRWKAQHSFHSTPFPGKRNGSEVRTGGQTCDVSTSSLFLQLPLFLGRKRFQPLISNLSTGPLYNSLDPGYNTEWELGKGWQPHWGSSGFAGSRNQARLALTASLGSGDMVALPGMAIIKQQNLSKTETGPNLSQCR